jgi:hypothetical protein
MDHAPADQVPELGYPRRGHRADETDDASREGHRVHLGKPGGNVELE